MAHMHDDDRSQRIRRWDDEERQRRQGGWMPDDRIFRRSRAIRGDDDDDGVPRVRYGGTEDWRRDYGGERYRDHDERYGSRGVHGGAGHGPYGHGSHAGQYGRSSYGHARDRYSEDGGYPDERGRYRSRGSESMGMAAGLGRGSMSGKGPKGYTRSDDRIREDVCDCLTDDPELDATNIEVQVRNGEVTLGGTVDSRRAKRHAEDVVERASGVRNVHNTLRLQESQDDQQTRTANAWPGGST